MNVFVDTSAFYAVMSRTDENYGSALASWNGLLSKESAVLYTSNYVIVETCALVRNRLGDDGMRDFLENILPMLAVIWVDQKTHCSAVEAMLAHGKNGPSLVDCASFAIMRANGISKALAFDRHFEVQGFGIE